MIRTCCYLIVCGKTLLQTFLFEKSISIDVSGLKEKNTKNTLMELGIHVVYNISFIILYIETNILFANYEKRINVKVFD